MSKSSRKNKRKRLYEALEQTVEADAPSSSTSVPATLEDEDEFPEDADTLPAKRKSDAVLPTGEAVPADEGWTTVTSRKKQKTSADHGVSADAKTSIYPSITHSSQARLQSYVKVGDLQNLVLFLFGEGVAPQWVGIKQPKAIRKVVVIMAPGLELDMFKPSHALKPRAATSSDAAKPEDASLAATSNEADSASPVLPQFATPQTTSPDHYYPKTLKKAQLFDHLHSLAEVFPHTWPIKSPGDDRTSQLFSDYEAMLMIRIQKPEDDKNAVKSGPRPPVEAKSWQDERTRIEDFIASLAELQEDLYALHPTSLTDPEQRQDEMQRREKQKQTSNDGWVDSNVSTLNDHTIDQASIPSDSILAGYDIIAIDCEMCQTESDPSALTRISAIGWDGNVIMDELVKPPSPVTDYLTPFSGITAEKLDPVTTTLSDIQQRLLRLLTPHTILVGHSLVSDLTALKLTHPLIVDTSLLYPHPRGPPYRSALKWLAQKYLSRSIQEGHGSSGHDSIEDARAALDLVKMKCEKGPTWGTPEASRESLYKRLQRAPRPNSTLGRLSSAHVGWRPTAPSIVHKSDADIQLNCENDDEVIDGVRRAVHGDADGSTVPGGGVDFVFAQLQTLSAVKGWWGPDRNAAMEKLRLKARARYAPQPASSLAPRTNNNDDDPPPQIDPFLTRFDDPLPPPAVDAALADTALRIRAIHESLPPTTALIVFSGAASAQRLQDLRQQYRRHQREFKEKKWDEATKWGEEEERELKAEFKRARVGVGFMSVK